MQSEIVVCERVANSLFSIHHLKVNRLSTPPPTNCRERKKKSTEKQSGFKGRQTRQEKKKMKKRIVGIVIKLHW